jgi:hypothetical protein
MFGGSKWDLFFFTLQGSLLRCATPLPLLTAHLLP